MIESALFDLFKNFPNHTVYIHNLGGFDSIYILESLCNISTPKCLFKDNKLISINATLDIGDLKVKNKIKLKFKDSLTLLPISLDRLIKELSIPTPKLHFPYKFPNRNNLNYVGAFPDYIYFNTNKLTLSSYNDLKSKYEGVN